MLSLRGLFSGKFKENKCETFKCAKEKGNKTNPWKSPLKCNLRYLSSQVHVATRLIGTILERDLEFCFWQKINQNSLPSSEWYYPSQIQKRVNILFRALVYILFKTINVVYAIWFSRTAFIT
jgi:hypothetical protein